MSNINIKISQATKTKLLLPIVVKFIKSVGNAVGQHQKVDVENANWFVISENKEKLKWGPEHTLEAIWENFEAYLLNKEKLFAFIEKKPTGLTSSEQTVWLFFSPATAKAYFYKQIEAPKNFNTKSLISVPNVDLLEPLTSLVDEILSHEKQTASQMLKRMVEVLKLSDLYMADTNRLNFQETFKKAMQKPLVKEVRVLKEELEMGSLEGLRKGRSRLVCVFILCWRFFRGKHKMEADYFKKLLEHEKETVLKGLKLAEKKLSL